MGGSAAGDSASRRTSAVAGLLIAGALFFLSGLPAPAAPAAGAVPEGGERDRGLLKVLVRARTHSSARPRLLLGDEGVTVRARLNGRRIETAFDPPFARKRKARLSRSHGLHYGRNRLRVVAVGADGAYDVETKRIEVPRRRPMAAAGRDRILRGPLPLRLRGTASRPARRRAGLTYSWKLVDAPPGSSARLERRRASKPRFRPDEFGDYRFRLTVRERGRGRAAQAARRSLPASRDTVRITQAPSVPPLGMPIETLGTLDLPGVTVNGQFYSLNVGAGNKIQVLYIDRETGAVLVDNDSSGSADDAANLLGSIEGPGADRKVIVVISATGDPGGEQNIDPAFNEVIAAIGGNPLPAAVLQRGGFSVIGIAGNTLDFAGEPTGAWQNRGWDAATASEDRQPGTLDGYLQSDSQGNFTFVPAERIALDTAAPGSTASQNTIAVGEQTFDSGALGCQGGGGFQVQWLTAETLRAGPGETFTTSGCGQQADEQGQVDLAAYLGKPPFTQGSPLIAIQSIGDPRGSDDGEWGSVETAIASLGGHLGSQIEQSYGLFSGVQPASSGYRPLPEFPVSESIGATDADSATYSAAHITGILKRTEEGYMAPEMASPTSSEFAFGLSLLAYQPNAGPPFPDSTGAEQTAALAYIAGDVLDLPQPSADSSCYVPPQPDVRSEYCNPNELTKWADSYASTLTAASYPGSDDFSEKTWDEVKCDLVGGDECTGPYNAGGYNEFDAIGQVWSDFEDLELYWGASDDTDSALHAVSTAAGDVRESIDSYKQPASGTWLDVIANILSGASYVSDDAGIPIGLVSTAFFLGEDVLNAEDGTPALGPYEVAVADFESGLLDALTGTYGQLERIKAIILTDGSKMRQLYEGNYIPDGDVLALAKPGVALGAARYAYRVLLPAAYEPLRLQREGFNDGVSDARDYKCSYIAGRYSFNYEPFPDSPPSAQWTADGSALWTTVEDGATLPEGGTDEVYPPTPSAQLTDPLFEPYGLSSDGEILGFDFIADSFWPTIWDLSGARSLECNPNGQDGPVETRRPEPASG